jgi:DnaJ-class molecular chaperone
MLTSHRQLAGPAQEHPGSPIDRSDREVSLPIPRSMSPSTESETMTTPEKNPDRCPECHGRGTTGSFCTVCHGLKTVLGQSCWGCAGRGGPLCPACEGMRTSGAMGTAREKDR